MANDETDAFGEAAEAQGAYIKLSSRPRVRCFLPGDLDIDAETRDGYATESVSATVTVAKDGFGGRPRPRETGTLEHGGESYEVAVSAEDTVSVQAAGNLYQFIVSNG